MDTTTELLRDALVRLAERRSRSDDAPLDTHLIAEEDLSGSDNRLATLQTRCRLSRYEVDILVVGAGVQIDGDFARVLQADQTVTNVTVPTLDSIARALGLSLLDPAIRLAMDGNGQLARHRLVRITGGTDPMPWRGLVVSDRLIRHLLGDDSSDASVDDARVPLVPIHDRAAASLARAFTSGVPLVHLREGPRAFARGLAASAAAAAGFPALGLDLGLIADERLDDTIDAAILEAVLGDAVLVIGPSERGPIDPVRLRTLADAPCPVVLHGREPLPSSGPVQHEVRMDVEPLDRAGRVAMWETVLDGCGLDHPGDLGQLATVPLAPERALHAALVAEATAVAEDRSLVVEDLAIAARGQGDGRLESLARLIAPAVGFDDLVVTDAVRSELARVVGRLRHHDLVRTVWGLDAVVGRSRGVTALFAGPSGTGKTLSAEALAGELGVDLYVVDLSSIVDKYIGETEKNLERVFTAAESHSGVLFFDEADALFGKRSEVRDAHDRFANIEVAYLLQRIEVFDGIAVLATNLRANLDDAFARRLDVIISFDEPDEEARLALWRRHLPATVPRSDDVDLGLLAAAVPLTGGLIRNVCLDAAYCAAADGTEVTMAHLVRSTARSQRMAGRLLDPTSFGPWSGLLDQG